MRGSRLRSLAPDLRRSRLRSLAPFRGSQLRSPRSLAPDLRGSQLRSPSLARSLAHVLGVDPVGAHDVEQAGAFDEQVVRVVRDALLAAVALAVGLVDDGAVLEKQGEFVRAGAESPRSRSPRSRRTTVGMPQQMTLGSAALSCCMKKYEFCGTSSLTPTLRFSWGTMTLSV